MLFDVFGQIFAMFCSWTGWLLSPKQRYLPYNKQKSITQINFLHELTLTCSTHWSDLMDWFLWQSSCFLTILKYYSSGIKTEHLTVDSSTYRWSAGTSNAHELWFGNVTWLDRSQRFIIQIFGCTWFDVKMNYGMVILYKFSRTRW